MDNYSKWPMKTLVRRLSVKRVLLALALGFCVLVTVLGLQGLYLGIYAQPIQGQAENYDELAKLPELHRRLDYFPRAAKNISFWFRVYGRGNITGEFDITEEKFLDWANSMGWHLDSSPFHDFVIIQRAGSEQNAIIEQGYHYTASDFELGYDKRQHRAYFVGLGHHRGPPTKHEGKMDR